MTESPRLIYISNTRIPSEKAHSFQMAKMCESFANQGARVELWIPKRAQSESQGLFEYYGLEKNFSIRTLWTIDLMRKGRPFQTFFYYLQTFFFTLNLLFIKVPKGSIVYTRHPDIAYIFSLRKANVVFEDHGWPERKRGLYLFLLKKVQKIVPITHGIEKLYKNTAGISKQMLVAPDAVELDLFKGTAQRELLRTEIGVSQDTKIITYTGSFYFYSWKGIDVLLETMKDLPQEYVVLLMGGSTEEIENIRSKYPTQQLHILERKSQKEIPYYLKASDVLILPNKTGDNNSEHYTSPLKLFEYMAAEVPIVASALPSIREILNDTNSYLVSPNDSKLLADKIIYVLSHEAEAKGKAMQAYDDVQNYTWKNRAKNIIEFIMK
jgi:glycosyltransferase involved in cell wall biosynthesis